MTVPGPGHVTVPGCISRDGIFDCCFSVNSGRMGYNSIPGSLYGIFPKGQRLRITVANNQNHIRHHHGSVHLAQNAKLDKSRSSLSILDKNGCVTRMPCVRYYCIHTFKSDTTASQRVQL